MIASLKGVLQYKGLDRLVVEVGGVGYLVFVSAQTLAELPQLGEPIQILCHTHVREDALQIFGFQEPEEQQVFELLMLVSGIGPKLALTTLSGIPVRELVTAIATEDHARLQRIPGIGRKTAERIVVELKDRCAKLTHALSPQLASPASPVHEVVDALVNLGYKRQVAEKVVTKVTQESESLMSQELILRTALAMIREA